MGFKEMIINAIPPRYRFYIFNLKNKLWGGYVKKYYSQSGEDVVVATLAKRLGIKTGFYVDVGAHHPERYSNTKLLFLQGWHGINIDPNPETIKLFKKARKHDVNLNIGVASEKQQLEYYHFSDPAINTFSAENAEKYKDKKWVKLLSVQKIQVLPLVEVFKTYVPSGTSIDLLNVDTEGFDFEILRSNDWNLYKPRIIIIEDHAFDVAHPDAGDIYCFLVEKGYHLYACVGFTLIFCD